MRCRLWTYFLFRPVTAGWPLPRFVPLHPLTAGAPRCVLHSAYTFHPVRNLASKRQPLTSNSLPTDLRPTPWILPNGIKLCRPCHSCLVPFSLLLSPLVSSSFINSIVPRSCLTILRQKPQTASHPQSQSLNVSKPSIAGKQIGLLPDVRVQGKTWDEIPCPHR